MKSTFSIGDLAQYCGPGQYFMENHGVFQVAQLVEGARDTLYILDLDGRWYESSLCKKISIVEYLALQL